PRRSPVGLLESMGADVATGPLLDAPAVARTGLEDPQIDADGRHPPVVPRGGGDRRIARSAGERLSAPGGVDLPRPPAARAGLRRARALQRVRLALVHADLLVAAPLARGVPLPEDTRAHPQHHREAAAGTGARHDAPLRGPRRGGGA